MCRKLICLICFVFVMVFAFVGTAQAATLLNSSFENWTGGPAYPSLFFTHWELYPGLVPPVTGIWVWGTGVCDVNTIYSHSGHASIRFHSASPTSGSGGAGIYQGVAVNAGTSCTISAYSKQLSAAGNAGIDMVWFTAIPSETSQNPPNNGRVDAAFAGTPDANGWRYCTLTAVAPANTKFVKYEIQSNNNTTAYDFVFDDVVGLPLPLIASSPYPDTNSIYNGGDTVTLTWDPGRYAATTNGHHVYFGSVKSDVRQGINGTDKGPSTPPNYPVAGMGYGTTYYWRIAEVNGPNTWPGNVWSFTVQPTKAYNPSPPNDANYVDPNAVLSWTAGAKAATTNGNKVYFGTTHPLPLVSTQTATTYDPPGQMAFDTLYYWHIDEVNGATTWQGDEWEFRTLARYTCY